MEKLDAKDYAILKEIDINFRQSFSKIGKKVRLSKNSVALRFEKLKEYMLHNATGLNNEILGYTMVKVYYTFDFYDEQTENEVIREVKKYKNILWAARFYGIYDLCVCFLVNNFDDLIFQESEFNRKFAGKINQKDMQIIFKQVYFRHSFIHEKPIHNMYEIFKKGKKISLNDTDKKILLVLRYNPRMNVVDIAKETHLSPKTVSARMRELEKDGVITGYFLTLDLRKFKYNTFKLLFQVQNLKKTSEFENYIMSNKNVRYITKMLGLWDYEVDFVYPSISQLQEELELMKQKFPNTLRKIAILSFGKRIVTNKENFLV
ncbi:MAG: Lrp/AsnC family transcriptional regulator [archaeon]